MSGSIGDDGGGRSHPDGLADLLVLEADPTASAKAFRTVKFVVRGGVLRPVGELGAR